jgi:hypothetical protein
MWLGVRFLIHAYEKIRLEWWKLRTNIVVTKKNTQRHISNENGWNFTLVPPTQNIRENWLKKANIFS